MRQTMAMEVFWLLLGDLFPLRCSMSPLSIFCELCLWRFLIMALIDSKVFNHTRPSGRHNHVCGLLGVALQGGSLLGCASP